MIARKAAGAADFTLEEIKQRLGRNDDPDPWNSATFTT